MRLKHYIVLGFLIAVASSGVSAECWPPESARDRSAVELTACFLSEVQICEETVPEFKAKASDGMSKFKSNPKFIEISRSKDFQKIRQETYATLKVYPVGQGSCNAIMRRIESGKF